MIPGPFGQLINSTNPLIKMVSDATPHAVKAIPGALFRTIANKVAERRANREEQGYDSGYINNHQPHNDYDEPSESARRQQDDFFRSQMMIDQLQQNAMYGAGGQNYSINNVDDGNGGAAVGYSSDDDSKTLKGIQFEMKKLNHLTKGSVDIDKDGFEKIVRSQQSALNTNRFLFDSIDRNNRNLFSAVEKNTSPRTVKRILSDFTSITYDTNDILSDIATDISSLVFFQKAMYGVNRNFDVERSYNRIKVKKIRNAEQIINAQQGAPDRGTGEKGFFNNPDSLKYKIMDQLTNPMGLLAKTVTSPIWLPMLGAKKYVQGKVKKGIGYIKDLKNYHDMRKDLKNEQERSKMFKDHSHAIHSGDLERAKAIEKRGKKFGMSEEFFTMFSGMGDYRAAQRIQARLNSKNQQAVFDNEVRSAIVKGIPSLLGKIAELLGAKDSQWSYELDRLSNKNEQAVASTLQERRNLIAADNLHKPKTRWEKLKNYFTGEFNGKAAEKYVTLKAARDKFDDAQSAAFNYNGLINENRDYIRKVRHNPLARTDADIKRSVERTTVHGENIKSSYIAAKAIGGYIKNQAMSTPILGDTLKVIGDGYKGVSAIARGAKGAYDWLFKNNISGQYDTKKTTAKSVNLGSSDASRGQYNKHKFVGVIHALNEIYDAIKDNSSDNSSGDDAGGKSDKKHLNFFSSLMGKNNTKISNHYLKSIDKRLVVTNRRLTHLDKTMDKIHRALKFQTFFSGISTALATLIGVVSNVGGKILGSLVAIGSAIGGLGGWAGKKLKDRFFSGNRNAKVPVNVKPPVSTGPGGGTVPSQAAGNAINNPNYNPQQAQAANTKPTAGTNKVNIAANTAQNVVQNAPESKAPWWKRGLSKINNFAKGAGRAVMKYGGRTALTWGGRIIGGALGSIVPGGGTVLGIAAGAAAAYGIGKAIDHWTNDDPINKEAPNAEQQQEQIQASINDKYATAESANAALTQEIATLTARSLELQKDTLIVNQRQLNELARIKVLAQELLKAYGVSVIESQKRFVKLEEMEKKKEIREITQNSIHNVNNHFSNAYLPSVKQTPKPVTNAFGSDNFSFSSPSVETYHAAMN